MGQHSLRHLAYVSLLAALIAPHTARGQSKAAPPIDGVIGKLQSFNGSSLDVQTPAGVVHVVVKQPLTTYKQIPSDLSHVAAASYIGVASAEGPTESKWRSKSSYFLWNCVGPRKAVS